MIYYLGSYIAEGSFEGMIFKEVVDSGMKGVDWILSQVEFDPIFKLSDQAFEYLCERAIEYLNPPVENKKPPEETAVQQSLF
ncbi:MAG: hypothetical protein WCT85_03865 [Parachlamydiales bacterium]|jgi:hypothetical protein